MSWRDSLNSKSISAQPIWTASLCKERVEKQLIKLRSAGEDSLPIADRFWADARDFLAKQPDVDRAVATYYELWDQWALLLSDEYEDVNHVLSLGFEAIGLGALEWNSQ